MNKGYPLNLRRYRLVNYMGVAVSNAISDKYGPKDSLDRAVKSFSNWIIDNGF